MVLNITVGQKQYITKITSKAKIPPQVWYSKLNQKRNIMPLLYTKLYDSGLIEMNEDLMCVFVEAHNRLGGGRDTVYLEATRRGVPLTMRNDFSDSGYLDYSTS